MSLTQWAENGWLRRQPSSASEVRALLAVIERDLGDADGSISPDWRFGIAYNAVLKLCTILIRAKGYRVEKVLHHHRTLQAMPLVLGVDREADAQYLEVCRKKRNILEYESPGGVTNENADELIGFARHLRKDVLQWLRDRHPEFLAEGE